MAVIPAADPAWSRRLLLRERRPWNKPALAQTYESN